MMLEPLRADKCYAFLSSIVVTAKGFPKAAYSHQSVPAHRHICANHITYGSILRGHSLIGASYDPIDHSGKQGGAGRKRGGFDRPAGTKHVRIGITGRQVL